MKKKLMVVVGLCGVVCLLVGAIALETQKSTVASYSDCVSAYLTNRKQMPPIPLPASAEELLERAGKGDWSFMANKHWYIHQPMTLYVAADSALAKETKNKLPMELMIMEDIRLGEIFLFSVDEKKGTWKPEASFTAPPIIDETNAEYARLSAEEKSRELFFELSYRRIIGEIALKPASALNELFARSTTAPTETVAEVDDLGGMMMRSSAPPAYSNNIWLCLEHQTNGTELLKAFAPESVSNVEVYACSDLVSNVWTLATTNLHPAGPTNPEYIA